MKKHIKTIIVVTVMAVLCVGYFYYLSHREPSVDANNKAADEKEVEALTTRDINNNYPESPKEVVKLYAKITKAYYKTELTDEQIKKLGSQARLLFDDELKSTQTDKEFLDELNKDIKEYRAASRFVSDFSVADSEEVEYKTFKEKKYASLNVLYMLRDGSELKNSLTRYTLRQDSEGRWKILYWELAGSAGQS